MTMIVENAVVCSVCKKESKHPIVLSTNAFGSCDLDTRPPEMQRSTMNCWVQECPHCGLIAGELNNPVDFDVALLQTEEYKSCDNIPLKSDLARRFYRFYLINKRSNRPKEAFTAALRAAWASDDAIDKEGARACRNAALERFDALADGVKSDDTYKLMRVDILRRAGRFDEAARFAESQKFGEELLQKIAAFEIKLARLEDDQCYTVKDALNERPQDLEPDDLDDGSLNISEPD
ncbi:MAG: hypothetical protein IJM30_10995 [Thermoguttaceae bacterium]|nr:hypothetical protein [Thermoguttaceae bacterium]